MKYTGFEEFLEIKYGDLPYCRQKHFLGGIWTYLPHSYAMRLTMNVPGVKSGIN